MHNSNLFEMKILETKNCILRPISLEDAPHLFEYYKYDKVVKYLPFKKHKNISDTENFIKIFFLKNYAKGKIGHYAIVLKKENKVIGNIGFNNISSSSKEGELGICINPLYWGYNLSSELAKEMLRYGFYDLNLKKIIAVAFEDNKYSQKPLQELGFHHVKFFNKKLYAKKSGAYVKCHKYEIFKKDYMISIKNNF
ncbi:GNAT family protein [Romboutsia sedimentorum]|uniref:GNAT family protein n=1 Tax=Romboutsia sedimentorum TaxID=1368474 RepID=A0ABT7E5J2_9FIRM|nr:GNAT family protein [Romboutsia sedimentorum]MDK2561937.1 GNAT family protein [Romboutsia sedimentorum]MDK2586731.1 GNAT family protein [Romboutsia sedimentorum]